MHHFKSWKQLVEKETGHTIKILCTDNGGEYTSASFEEYLQNQGITHQIMAPYTSAQNGKAEQLHQTLFNCARAIMAENKFPAKLWGECMQATAYLRDCTPTRMLKNMTPYQAHYGLKLDLSHLRELGCRAFILIQPEHQKKINSHSFEGILVGYSHNSKTYRCYYPKTGRIFISCHVTFIESKDSIP